jgi:hypothetical protein
MMDANEFYYTILEMLDIKRKTYKKGEIVKYQYINRSKYNIGIKVYIKYGNKNWWGIYINDEFITHRETKSAARSLMRTIIKVYELGYFNRIN